MPSEFSVVSNFQTTLSAPMTNSQLTVPVNSIYTRDDTPVLLTTALMGTGWYLTIDPGLSSEEFVKITAVTPTSGTAGTFTVDAAGRGLAYSGNTDAQGAGNAKPHNPGAVVILSNAKNVYDRLVDRESDETIGGAKTFTEVAFGETPTAGQTAALATVEYVNDAAISGANNAAVGVKGIVEIGTQTQVDTGDDSGSTNAISVVIPSTHLQTWDMVVTTDITYGDTIAVGDCVYIDNATGRWKLSDGTNSEAAQYSCGFALDAGVDGETGKRVQTGGVVTGLSGLQPGRFVYVSNTPGEVAATAGNHSKVIGVGLSSSALLIYGILDIASIFGVNPTVTSNSVNLMGVFFDTPLKQGIKTAYTAGQDLAIGEVVALESDSKVYRTRPTGFSNDNAGNGDTLATTNLGALGKMQWYDTPTPTIKAFLGQNDDLANKGWSVTAAVVDSNFATTTLGTPAELDPASDLGDWDSVLFNTDKIAVCGALAGGTVIAACCSDVDGTPAFGSAITLGVANSCAITDTDETDTLVAFTNEGSQVTSYRITNSGNTLTEGANDAFIGGSALSPKCAARFTGTDYIALVYFETAANYKVAIGQYDASAGTWNSVGSPATIISSGAISTSEVMIEVLDDTHLLVIYLDTSGFDMEAVVITRSGTTATVGTPVTILSAAAAMNCITLKKLGKYSFLAGGDTNAGGKLQLCALDRDFTTVETVGSVLTNGSTNNEGIAGCLLTPGRWMAMAGGTNSAFNSRQFTSNLNSAVGVIEAEADEDAVENVVTNGWTDVMSGLTPGTAYYTDIDGQLTTSTNGITPLIANDDQSPLTRRVLVAETATDVNIKI